VSESINALHLPPRAWNALTRYGIKTVDDLCALSAERVLEFTNIGTGTLKVIEDALAARGRKLAADMESGLSSGRVRRAAGWPPSSSLRCAVGRGSGSTVWSV
jgi:DNA-directed RNA polymerase alpha subunit